MSVILIDTGVWISLLDEKDTCRERKHVEDTYLLISGHNIIMPWPVVCETLRTRLVKNSSALIRFEKELKSPKIRWLDDSSYREQALADTFEYGLKHRHLSMVDCALRLIMEDANNKIEYFATWNTRDFSDVCAARNIDILD